MKIFLTGATGFVGRHLLRRLLLDGHQVTASARSPASAQWLRAAGAQPFERSLLEASALQAALQGHDVLLHGAARLRTWGAWADFQADNVDLTRALLAGAQAAGVGQFIHLSAASVVMQGPEPMRGVDESATTTCRPELPYSSTKALAETLVLQAAAPGLRTLALRPPLVWGAGDAVDGELGRHIAGGHFAWFGGGRYPYATCHVDNLGEAVALGLRASCSGVAIFITDGEPVLLRDFLSRRIAARGLPVPRLSVPVSAAWALAGLAEAGWRRLGRVDEPPLTREAVRLLGYPFTLDTRRSADMLGYRPVVTVDEGLRQLQRGPGAAPGGQGATRQAEVG